MKYLFGEWFRDDLPLTAAEAAAVCEQAELRREAAAAYPLDRVLRIVEAMGEKWRSPAYPLRREVEALLPRETGFSPEMVRLGLDHLGNAILQPEALRRKLLTETRGWGREGTGRYDPATGTRLDWHPLGVVLHVLSGNVFLVGASSFLEGLLTGNVNILKMSSAERVFLPRLIDTLRECDPAGTLASLLAVVEYPSSDREVIAIFSRRVDGLVVWGGEEAVNVYRAGLPARTRLVVFGPKLSLAVVSRRGLEEQGAAPVAAALAREISLWDQHACTAPQVCYVEGEDHARLLAAELGKALEGRQRELPAGAVDPAAAVEIRKMRTVAEVAEARGESLLLESSRDLDWTVVLDRDPVLAVTPLHRTLRLVPYGDRSEVIRQVEGLRGYVQTVGLAVAADEWPCATRDFARAGGLRLVALGEMGAGEIDDPHDGGYDLPQLMNLIIVRNRSQPGGEEYEPLDFAPAEERAALIDARLRRLAEVARRAPFYRERLGNLRVETTDDLAAVPILTRDEMERAIPPGSRDLATGPWTGGYVTRSGGSTGEPKFSIYDGRDWEAMVQNAVRLFRAMGLRPGDRLANCFLAGDLYGSFVSFDHINCRVGAATFAFASDVKPAVFLDVWRKFFLNVVQGVPTVIVPLFRTVKQADPAFTMEKVIYAGSPLSRTDYEWMVVELKTRRIASIIGANDGCQMAFQCASQRGTLHHAVDDYNFLEIVDERGRRVSDGETGKILITSLLKYAFPLIRYEIGDQGRIVPGPCACGRTLRVLEYLGRSDNVIVVGLLNVGHRDFAEAFRDFPVSELQLAAKNSDGREYLAVRVESDQGGEDFRRRLYQALLERVAKLRDRLEAGTLARVEVSLHPPGTLLRNPRTGKLKHVVDERK